MPQAAEDETVTEKVIRRLRDFQLTGKRELAMVVLLLAAGIFIRAFHFGVIPVGVHQDEAMAAVDALALLKHGTDRFGMRFPVHFTAWGNSQMSVFLSYCMIPFIKMFGFSIVSIRLPLLITSCVGLLAVYLFGRHVGGVKLAFPVLILCVICPWHYIQSRWSIDCNMFPHVFLFGVCLLLTGMKRRWALYVSMLFFGLCSYCYGIANYSVPVFLVIMAAYLLAVKKVKWREVFFCLLIYFLVVLPEFLTMLINMMGWDTIETPLFTIPRFPGSTRSEDILFFNFSWETLKVNLWKVTSIVFGNSWDDSVVSIIPKFDNLYPFTTIFFLIGLYVLVRSLIRKGGEHKLACVTLAAWLFMALWAGIITKGVGVHRINILFYPMIVTSGVGIAWCIEKWRILAVPVACAYGVASLLFAHSYFGEYGELSRQYYYDPYVNALYFAKTLDCEAYFIMPDPQRTGEEQVGEILTRFCHELDAEYCQGLTCIQDGQEVLPYSERYRYEMVTEETLRRNEGKRVIYLISSDEIGLFSADKYDITSFYDAYYVVFAD